ncbi:MAG: hypothetical protein DRI44_08300 [Chlamydiae bacterium]|nr:MAG: hypothetical protein DRI44_08300 [Chlamydiota bacterium]
MKKIISLIVLTCSFLLMNTTSLMAASTLQASTNGRFIVKADGAPFYPQSDWGTELLWKLNLTDATSYLTARKAQGFNMITAYAVDSGGDNPDYTSVNINGDAPFELTVGGDYDGRWNILAPVEAYWTAVDAIIDAADAQGLYINLLPLPAKNLLLGSYRVMPRGDDANAYAYGNWIGQRYAGKTNIIWSLGGGAPQNDWFDISSQINAMAKGIADGVNGVTNNLSGATDYSTTLMTYDTERWTHSSSYWFNNEGWLDFNSLHEVPGREGKPEYNQVTEITGDYALTPVKPTWLLGSVVEGNHDFTDWQSRFQVYQTVFAGGFGSSYGNRNVGSFDTGWDTNMNSAGALDMKFITDLMTTSASNYQFLTRVPDQSLIVGDTGSISGSGYYQDYSDIIQATRTEDGKYAMIYCANGRDITVNMSKLANGTVSANWYNPRTGDWTVATNNLPSGLGTANVTFNTPGETSDYGNDWVLVLDLVAGPAPIDPLVNITNQDAFVTYDITEYTIGGTNNENVVGTMIWSNQLTVAGGSFSAAPSWTIANIGLNVGANVIKVVGENSLGAKANDSVTITRGVPGTGNPVLDITTADTTVPYNTIKYAIGFTINTNVVGMAQWVNTASGLNGNVDVYAGIIEDIALNIGTNLITVIGTNVFGQESTDSVTIFRTPSLATPFIDITTGNTNVNFGTAQLDVIGTNVNIVGTMNWENQFTGASGSISATNNWVIPNVVLNVGANVITVTGTNVYGDIANARATITRYHESKVTLKVSDNGRFIVKTDGTPFFPQNDWATKIVWKLTSSDAASYISQRAAQGFNMITMYSVDVTNTDGSATYDMVNANGYAPFVNVSDKWDPMQPVSEYWTHVGNLIDTAAANGMYVNLMPLPARFVGYNEAYRIFAQGDVSNCYNYGFWIGSLFADKTNLIWSIGGGLRPDYYYDYLPQYNAMAKGIADGVNGASNNYEGVTDYSSTLMTYDAERWTHSSSYWFQNEGWLDFNSLHEVPGREGKPEYNQVTEITEDYAKTPVKPTWLLGAVSEYQKDYFLEWQSRFQVYQTIFAGGFGCSYGNRNVENFTEGWNTNMNSAGALQMQYVTALLTSVSNNMFLTRIPDQSIIEGDTGEISGTGWYQSDSDIIQATRTEYADHAMIYCANGRDITVKMHKLASGTMSAYWYSPRSGDYTLISEDIDSGLAYPNITFDPPGSEGEEGNDWVLVLNLEQIPEPTLLIGGFLLGLAFLRRK